MGDFVVEMMLMLIRTAWWIIRTVGGFLIGMARTHEAQAYQPKQLGDALDLDLELQAFVIRVPKSQAWDAPHALQFVTHLIALGRCFLQIIAEQSGISFRVVFIDGIDTVVAQEAILSFYPDSSVEIVPYFQHRTSFPMCSFSVPFATANIFPAPILQADQIKYFDPLIPLTQAISQLGADETIIYTVAILDEAVTASEAGFRQITASDIRPIDYTYLTGMYVSEIRKAQGLDRIPRFEGSIQRVLEQKLNSLLYHCLFFVQIEAPTEERVKQLGHATLHHAAQFANMPFNLLIPPEHKQKQLTQFFDITDPKDEWLGDVLLFVSAWLSHGQEFDPDQNWRRLLLVLQQEEIAALWHLPYEGFSSSAIQWITAKQVALPKALRALKTVSFLGYNRYGGQQQAVYLPLEDRTSHVTIVGKSGTGKSNLIHHLIADDIANGRGVCVVDPHGTLVSHILQTSIPKTRDRDVVVLDLANSLDGQFYPPPLNLLAKPDPTVEAGVAVGMLMDIFTKMYDSFAETRMASLLSNALMTLSVQPQPTLLDIERLFSEPIYRVELLDKMDNLMVKRFWSRFDAESLAQQQQMTAPLLRRLDSFYTNNTLLAITCHPTPIDLKSLMRQNKIILVSLAADETKIQKLERELLGAVLVAQVQMAAMSGAIQRTPYMLYVDEAQQLISTSLPTMLSEARKYGLGLVLANQYYKQLAGETFDAVEGNVGTIIAFEVGESDARLIASYMKPAFTQSDLVALGKYRAAISLRYAGERQPAFSLETLPIQTPKDAIRREQYLRRLSVESYTPTPYSEVKKWLHQRYAPDTTTKPTRQGDDDEFIEPKTPTP
jgi:RecA/RadA recombinase